MEWVFYIMVVFCLFDIEEKLKKLMTNNQEKNNTQKEKNKIILENYIGKKVSRSEEHTSELQSPA